MIAPGDVEGLASQASLGQSMPEEVSAGVLSAVHGSSQLPKSKLGEPGYVEVCDPLPRLTHA
jgi:hypothetical protein